MGLFGSGARQKQRRRVEQALKSNNAWRIEVQGRWICPFCATPALKVSSDPKEKVAAILDHLDGACEGYRGEGDVERPIGELRNVAARRQLRSLVKQHLKSNPSWQLIDVSQRWYCAYCGDPTEVVVPKNRKMTGETLGQIIDHVEACYAYKKGKGKEKPFAHLKAIVKYNNQSRKLAENVRNKLEGDPAWRRKGPGSCWICPYCLENQTHIDLSSNLLMFENAPALIAGHLAAACEAFKSGAQPQPLQSASRSGQSRSPLASGGASDTGGIDIFADSVRLGDLRREQPPPSSMEMPVSDSARWGDVKDPQDSPTGRYKPTLWGKDGMAAQKRAERGTTLRQLEESGEYMLIDDPEMREFSRQADEGEKPSTESSIESSSRSAASWRREIEAELASVKQMGLGRSGEHVLSGSHVPSDDPDADVSSELGLPRRGLTLRRVELRAKSPRGDFVDAMALSPERMAIFAGGVAGEDAEAQLIAAMARNLLRTHAGPNRCPSEVLQRVNSDIFGDLDGRSFVAVTYMLVDLASCRARVARAGLSPPVLLNPARNPRLLPLDSEGMVMGIDKGPLFDSSLEVRSLEMHPGDLLVLFTKGVIEARGAAREEFGLTRMHQLIERYGTHEVEYFTDKFQEYFHQHVQRRRDTDACVIALRREAPA